MSDWTAQRVPVVVLDANVLFPLTLRDTLLRLAAAGRYQLRWSEPILDEMERNLVSSLAVSALQASRLRAVMATAFPDAMVDDFEPLARNLRNDAKDRHVVAAALKAKASLIITANLRDFVPLPAGIRASSPDPFLCAFLDYEAAFVIRLLREQAADMTNPPVSLSLLLQRLHRVTPKFATESAHLIRSGL
jgi:predicted nucleic acid-binding protein